MLPEQRDEAIERLAKVPGLIGCHNNPLALPSSKLITSPQSIAGSPIAAMRKQASLHPGIRSV